MIVTTVAWGTYVDRSMFGDVLEQGTWLADIWLDVHFDKDPGYSISYRYHQPSRHD